LADMVLMQHAGKSANSILAFSLRRAGLIFWRDLKYCFIWYPTVYLDSADMDSRVWLTLTRFCDSLHGLDTFWARGLSWMNNETTATTKPSARASSSLIEWTSRLRFKPAFITICMSFRIPLLRFRPVIPLRNLGMRLRNRQQDGRGLGGGSTFQQLVVQQASWNWCARDLCAIAYNVELQGLSAAASVWAIPFHPHAGSRINFWTFSQTHISKSELKNGHISRFCSVFKWFK